MLFANIFSLSDFLFFVLMVFFSVQEFSLIRKNIIKMNVTKHTVYIFFQQFYDFSSYILVFKTFWVIFIHVVRKISSFILLHVAVQFAQNLLIEDSVFAPTVYSCLFCHRLIDRRCMGLFWFYFVPFIYVFVAVPYNFGLL